MKQNICGRLYICTKVYAYADGHTPERKMILSTYFQMLQAVIIQYLVIDPPTGSAFAIDSFVLLCISADSGLETQISMVFYVDSAPITVGEYSALYGQELIRPR